MKNKFNYLILLCVLGVAGCKKEVVQSDEKVTSASKKSLALRSSGDNEWDLLGFGYDVTGEFGNESARRNSAINVVKLKKDHPDRVTLHDTPSNLNTVDAGANSTDYSLDLTGKFDASASFLLFKGSVYGSYSDKTKTSNKYSYARISQNVKRKTLELNAPKELLTTNYLTEQFKYDINALSAADLVKAYGTHVLTHIVLGGRLELNYRSETRGSDRKKAATAGATINGLASVFSIKADFTYDESTVRENFNQTLSYRTIGGDPTLSIVKEVSLDKPIQKIDITPWMLSCTPENARLIEVVKGSSIPLYELIADATKKQAVKNYINIYLYNNQVRDLGDVPVYGFFSARFMDHVYKTANESVAGGDHQPQGVQFYAFSTQAEGTVPVYGFFSARHMDHVYKLHNGPVPGGDHQPQGIQFYAYATPGPGRIPVYSYFSARHMDHVLKTENVPVAGGDHAFEGISFYVPE